MDNNYFGFRKASFGGFNRKDVINYIERMKNEFHDYKKAVESTVEQLNRKISELEESADTSGFPAVPTVQQADSDSADLGEDISAATEKLRAAAGELYRSLDDFMKKVAPEMAQAEDYEPEEVVIEDEAEEAVSQSDTEAEQDVVSKILSVTGNFTFCSSGQADKKPEAVELKADSERPSVLATLGSFDFIN